MRLVRAQLHGGGEILINAARVVSVLPSLHGGEVTAAVYLAGRDLPVPIFLGELAEDLSDTEQRDRAVGLAEALFEEPQTERAAFAEKMRRGR